MNGAEAIQPQMDSRVTEGQVFLPPPLSRGMYQPFVLRHISDRAEVKMIPLAGLDAEGVEVTTGVISDRAISHPLGFQFPAHWLAQVERDPGSGPVVVNG